MKTTATWALVRSATTRKDTARYHRIDATGHLTACGRTVRPWQVIRDIDAHRPGFDSCKACSR